MTSSKKPTANEAFQQRIAIIQGHEKTRDAALELRDKTQAEITARLTAAATTEGGEYPDKDYAADQKRLAQAETGLEKAQALVAAAQADLRELEAEAAEEKLSELTAEAQQAAKLADAGLAKIEKVLDSLGPLAAEADQAYRQHEAVLDAYHERFRDLKTLRGHRDPASIGVRRVRNELHTASAMPGLPYLRFRQKLRDLNLEQHVGRDARAAAGEDQ